MDFFFNLHYCLFKINEKKPSIEDFFFFSVVPKSYGTVTPETRYVPNRDICVPCHPYYIYNSLSFTCHDPTGERDGEDSSARKSGSLITK